MTYGMVAQSGPKGSLICSAPVMSSAVDFATAVGDVLQELRSQTKKSLPKSAVLVASWAVSELLVLPVDPSTPRPRSQMNELVRWEFEEVYAQQSDLWSLGALMQGKGYVSPQQRRELETGESSGHRRVSVADAYRKTVSTDQFEECLSLQERLMATEDELALGWAAQSPTHENGRFAWLCAGAGSQTRSQWVKALKKHRVTCSWIYPQMGASLPLIDGLSDALMVDIRQEQFGLFQMINGQLDSVSTGPCLYGQAEPDTVALAVAKFMNPDIRVVHVSAPMEQFEQISEAISKMLKTVQVKSVVLSSPEASQKQCPRPVLASLEGVARHALKLSQTNAVVRIEGQPPRPALWKNPSVWPWAIIALLIISLTSVEVYTRIEARATEVALEDLDIEFDYRLRIQNEAREMRAQIQRLEKVQVDKQLELDRLLRRIDILNNVVIYRQKLIPGLLEAIGDAGTQGVVLDMLEENKDRSGFYLEGWAMKDTLAQQFAKRLNQNLVPWKYAVGGFELSRGKGRYGIDGFNLKVRLTPKTDVEQPGND
ncbi:MAG TPA: hypothetical protein DCM28_15075 [Phycisphaerales bacterium]|nr:hypothetical protein [Phycisphaerales bacterium]